MNNKKLAIFVTVLLQSLIMLLTISNSSYYIISTMVSISLVWMVYVRLFHIEWSARIDSLFKFKDNVEIQKKEAIMILFLPTFLAISSQLDTQKTISIHAVVNVSALALIAIVEFLRRIRF